MAGHYLQQEDFEAMVVAVLVTALRRRGRVVDGQIEDIAQEWSPHFLEMYRDETMLVYDLRDAASYLYGILDDEDYGIDFHACIHYAYYTLNFSRDGRPKKRGMLNRLGLRGSRFAQSDFNPTRVQDFLDGFLQFVRMRCEGLIRLEHLAPSGWNLPYTDLVAPW